MDKMFYNTKYSNILKVRNSFWRHSGGKLLRWLDKNLPEYKYTLKFSTTKQGRVIKGRPVTIEFDTPGVVVLITLIGIDLD